jgi:hypothetical protein
MMAFPSPNATNVACRPATTSLEADGVGYLRLLRSLLHNLPEPTEANQPKGPSTRHKAVARPGLGLASASWFPPSRTQLWSDTPGFARDWLGAREEDPSL